MYIEPLLYHYVLFRHPTTGLITRAVRLLFIVFAVVMPIASSDHVYIDARSPALTYAILKFYFDAPLPQDVAFPAISSPSRQAPFNSLSLVAHILIIVVFFFALRTI